MPAKSKAQQKAAGAALAAKRRKSPKSKLRGASRSMYESMSEKKLEEFASTKRKGKPEHKAETKRKSTTSRRTAAKRGSAASTKSRARKSATTRKTASAGRRKSG